jgi:poly-gamma-glutamate synthesis protein (capsule biosynthesis protein)
MNPANGPCLTAAGIDCCVLANNHVLDWGLPGLLETLETLEILGVQYAGAGRDTAQAEAPAVLEIPRKGRVLVFAFGSVTSGIPREWAAGANRPGVNLLADLSNRTIVHIADRVHAAKRPGDVAVASIHWGGNWGYDVPREHVDFAHALIAAGASIVHGHSSHHVRPIEVHRGRLILYGCGDFLTDYEGIGQRPGFRDDLVVMYFPVVDGSRGALTSLQLAPLRIRRFRLERPSADDARRLRDTLDRISKPFGTRVGGGDRRWTATWT